MPPSLTARPILPLLAMATMATFLASTEARAQAAGQPPTKLTVRVAPDGSACSTMRREVGLVVVDRRDRPVEGVEVEVTRDRTRSRVGDSLRTDVRGAVTVLHDGQVPDLVSAGEGFTVRLRRPRGAWTSVRLTLGHEDATRCHVARLAGSERVVLP